jgi:hypothetical protein
MKPKTIDELSGGIRKDLGWRRRENQAMQHFVRASQGSRKQAALRGAVAVLYAHWEGFVKASGRAYFEYVKQRRLANDALALPFLALSVERKYGKIESNEGQSPAHNFME